MGRHRSFLCQLNVEHAIHSHDCQGKTKHRIHAGDLRLSAKKDRSPEKYCVLCAKESLNRDIGKLQKLLDELSGSAELDKSL
jgi:hypothetical protein